MKNPQVNKQILIVKNMQKRLEGEITPNENEAIDRLVNDYSLRQFASRFLKLAIVLAIRFVFLDSCLKVFL